MTTTTNEFGQQNMFAKEPEMYIDPKITTQMENNTYSKTSESENSKSWVTIILKN